VNELRVVIFVFSLLGMGLCCLLGIDLADDGDAESIKGVIVAGFAMLSAATIAAGALNGIGRPSSKSQQVSFGGRGEMPAQGPYQPYGQPTPPYGGPVPQQPGQPPTGQPQ
jgi:hypothetical protein